jgi:hypothetical protein
VHDAGDLDTGFFIGKTDAYLECTGICFSDSGLLDSSFEETDAYLECTGTCVVDAGLLDGALDDVAVGDALVESGEDSAPSDGSASLDTGLSDVAGPSDAETRDGEAGEE